MGDGFSEKVGSYHRLGLLKGGSATTPPPPSLAGSFPHYVTVPLKTEQRNLQKKSY